MLDKPKEITILEIYERLIQLETKFDMAVELGAHSQRKFWILSVLLLASIIADIIIHFILHLLRGEL